jgi:hypothetical protein
LPGIEGDLGVELEHDILTEIAKEESSDYLYERSPAGLRVVNVLPQEEGGKLAPNATFGAPPFPEVPQFDQPNFTRAISEDGNRVFWTDLNTGNVYARVDGSKTVKVSQGPAQYWTASTDGRYAFYTEEGRLYRFDLEAPGSAQERVSFTGPESSVTGVIGASEDGATVYLVADQILTSHGNSEGEIPIAGEPNLYVTHDGAPPVFIATLSAEDGREIQPFQSESVFVQKGEYGDWLPGSGQRTARVAGDGSAVVFMSNRPLASVGFPGGYPNNGLEEVYSYDSTTNRLFCVSCSSNGGPPQVSEGRAAAFLPISWSLTYLPQWVSDDGSRVFFNSAESLVTQDTNDLQDVYEWEREGSGSCTRESAVNGGCIALLSAGDSKSYSWLLGASASGNDVFVITRAQLSSEDHNETFDMYDARVNGVVSLQVPVCTGGGCQGIPVSQPVFATPPSVTFAGAGNFPVLVKSKKSRTNHHAAAPSRRRKLKGALKLCNRLTNKQRIRVCRVRARKRDSYSNGYQAGGTRHPTGPRGQ